MIAYFSVIYVLFPVLFGEVCMVLDVLLGYNN